MERRALVPYDCSLRVGIPPGTFSGLHAPGCQGSTGNQTKPDYSLTGIADAYGIEIGEPIRNYDSDYDSLLPVKGGSAQ